MNIYVVLATHCLAGVPLIIAKIILDDIALIAEAKDELLVAEVRVNFHDMPKDGPLAHGHHGLGPKFRFLAQPRP